MGKSTSTTDFLTSFDEYTNLTLWGNNDIYPGTWAPNTAYIGGTPEASIFEMKTVIQWELIDYNSTQVHNLEIRAKALGFSKQVVATVNITLNTSALGYAQLTHHKSDNVGKTASALSRINDAGTLNLAARIQNFSTQGKYMQMDIALVLRGNMPRGFVPKGVEICAVDNSLNGLVNFKMEYDNFTNATFWSNVSGNADYHSANVGCIPTASVFVFKTMLHWEIYNLSTPQIPTLHIEARLLGPHSEVMAVSTIEVVQAS
jgi:hypothetical protein